MRVLICVDDTDDLTKATSTGKIADMIAEKIVSMGGKLYKGVTRHQLLLHEEIKYTSHNSSMCMEAEVDDIGVHDLEKAASRVILENMAATADPGLCICPLDLVEHPQMLVAYGRRAQKEVLQKEEAFETAKKAGVTVLKEYGGDGSGVIGALAGVGLRLSGCDGTFRGGKEAKYAGCSYSAGQWLEKDGIEQVVDIFGNPLEEETLVIVEDRIKLALWDNKKTFVVRSCEGKYYGCDKQALYGGDRKISSWAAGCGFFVRDNDGEECYTDEEEACWNCLYRRWTPQGYGCVKEK